MAQPNSGRIRNWLSPVVFLSNNVISLIGVVLVTTSSLLWLFLLPIGIRGEAPSPYLGILAFLVLPGFFFLGLALIPLGIFLASRKRRRVGLPIEHPPLTWRSPDLRRLAVFVGITTIANLIIGTQLTYRAVHYMDSVTFCGQTCHTVMQPEFAAYQNSPHSRVACVECHIGSGASWFVRSKLSGMGQVFAVTFNTYPRPIPTPIENLRPARDTCEQCHWPQKFGPDRLRVISHYADDEANTHTQTVLLMRIGGLMGGKGRGIHGAHLDPGVVIEYAPSDHARQIIPLVEYRNLVTGRTSTYLSADADPEKVRNLPRRQMDCMDCHNRPTHAFELPEGALNRAMTAGDISPSLPFVKKQSLGLLRKDYSSHEEAAKEIQTSLNTYYRENHPAIYTKNRDEIERVARAVLGIYERNVFPAMKVTWGTYPNNIGHMDFPGCFRCHDERTSADGRTITQDCDSCHRTLAMEEPSPKILTDLGLANEAAAANSK